MPTLQEILYRLYGAWRLFRLDRGGMAFFDGRVETFWQSFFAAVLVAPGYLIVVAVDFSRRELAASAHEVFLVESIGYVISWTAFPLALFYLTRAFDRGSRFIPYIAAYNWAKVIQILLYLPVTLVSLLGLLPGPAMQLAHFVVVFVVLGYDWFIARTALDIPGGGAVGIVVFDLVLGLVIAMVADGMIY